MMDGYGAPRSLAAEPIYLWRRNLTNDARPGGGGQVRRPARHVAAREWLDPDIPGPQRYPLRILCGRPTSFRLAGTMGMGKIFL